MKAACTWILIADAGRARILESKSPGKGLQPIAGQSFENRIPKGHDLVRDQAPRTHDSIGPGRHAMTGSSDPRRKEKRRFADELAEALEKAAGKNAFDRLVLVAPPQVLGDLRVALAPAVAGKVIHELAKDLTKSPDADIPGQLDLPYKL